MPHMRTVKWSIIQETDEMTNNDTDTEHQIAPKGIAIGVWFYVCMVTAPDEQVAPHQ